MSIMDALVEFANIIAMAMIVVGFMTWGHKALKPIAQNVKSNNDGTKAVLKSTITSNYERVIDKGCISIHTLGATLEMYESYKALGGNGTMDNLIEKINKLPVKRDEP